jgi:hypothetical protein
LRWFSGGRGGALPPTFIASLPDVPSELPASCITSSQTLHFNFFNFRMIDSYLSIECRFVGVAATA